MFKKAERRQVKLKLALTAPSGGGKTYSALLMATGIGKRIAVVDTENGSAALYADRFGFDTLEIEPPYTIQKYVAAIQGAQAAGYDVLVIDSLSHAWAGDGGLMAKKEAMDARGGNSFANWGAITKEQEHFKAAILNADIHMIVTMRSKQDYVLEVSDKGKSTPRKVGLAPIQREGMEYEFTTVFDIAMDHNAAVSKDRTGLFDGQIFKIGKDTGEKLMAWLNSGKAPEPKPVAQTAPTIVNPEESKQPQRINPPGPITPPKQAVAPPVQQPEGTDMWCDGCESQLIHSVGKKCFYCPRYQDKTTKHSYVPEDQREFFMERQAGAVGSRDSDLPH